MHFLGEIVRSIREILQYIVFWLTVKIYNISTADCIM